MSPGHTSASGVGANSPTTNKPKSGHLAYLDGVRGVAALYVFLYHIWQFMIVRADFESLPTIYRFIHVLKYGNYAVSVFIVLSGYCLMLPVVRSSNHSLSGGLKAFFLRRARRILPAYYATLLLCTLLIVAFPMLQHTSGMQWDIALPALSPGSLLSHIALVHNLFRQWRWKLDPPLWSVALEWQIYFLFALVLLPMWKRLGLAGMLLIAFVISVLPLSWGWDYICSWYVGAFALGMAGAVINFAPDIEQTTPLRNAPWLAISAVLWGIALVCFALQVLPNPALMDILVGMATAAFLIGYTHTLQTHPGVKRKPTFFEMRGPIALGTFSYSLYLIHYPLLSLFLMVLTRLHIPLSNIVLILLGVGAPLIVGSAYLFYCLCERPFMRRPAA